MKVVPMAQVRNRFASLLEESKAEPVFITRNGKIAAVLEGMSDDQVEDFLLERSPRGWPAVPPGSGRSAVESPPD